MLRNSLCFMSTVCLTLCRYQIKRWIEICCARAINFKTYKVIYFRHIHGLMRRDNRHFKLEIDHKAHWTGPYYRWLDKVVKESAGSFKLNLILLLKQLKDIDLTVKEYKKEIDTLAQSLPYKSKVEALTCYKGIRNLFAMTMITEIGDIKRFEHPRSLASWIGLDIREYLSGALPAHSFTLDYCRLV